MLSFKEFMNEEVKDAKLRDLEWISKNVDFLIDFFAQEYKCDADFDASKGGIIIYPNEVAIEVDEGIKKRFFEMFGKEMLDVFPNKWTEKSEEETYIVISPYNKGDEVPSISNRFFRCRKPKSVHQRG